MKKKYFLGLIFTVVLFVLTGCSEKPSINSSDFKSISENSGYTVYDITSQYSEYSYIESALVAKSSWDYQVEFYLLTDDSYAVSMFNNNKSTFESYKGSSSVDSSVDLANYSTYSLTSNGYYMYLSRIDNTLLYLRVDDSYKSNVKNLVSKLGY